jgi:hypothetical protein
MATFTYRSSSYLFMVFRFSYSTGWGVFCKSKEKTTKECRICCWALLKLHTVGWRHILPNMYAFVSLKKFFFHIFGDVKYVHDQYCQFTDSRGSLMVLGHWWSWITDVIGSLMVFGSGSSRPGRLTGGHLCSVRLLSGKRDGGGVKVIFRPGWLRGEGRWGIGFKTARGIYRHLIPWLNTGP